MSRGLAWMVVAVMGLAGGCASTPQQTAPPRMLSATIKENFEARQFEISIRNDTSTPLCFSILQWPLAKGGMFHTFRQMALEQDGKSYEQSFSLTDFCSAGDCGYEVIRPGEVRTASIAFSLFDAPGLDQPNLTRQLRFKPVFSRPCEPLKPLDGGSWTARILPAGHPALGG